MDIERQAADFSFTSSRARCTGMNLFRIKQIKLKDGRLFFHDCFYSFDKNASLEAELLDLTSIPQANLN